ncbi:MAG: hypothetical protein WCK11_03585 [Candidatus Falkowbacteria bacterium]
MTENIIQYVVDLIEASDRSMPAHFSSRDDRAETFWVDFKDLSASTEVAMASSAYLWLNEMVTLESKQNFMAVLKTGEDIMIGTYIIARLDSAEIAQELIETIARRNIEFVATQEQFAGIAENVLHADVQAYWKRCAEHGLACAG